MCLSWFKMHMLMCMLIITNIALNLFQPYYGNIKFEPNLGLYISRIYKK